MEHKDILGKHQDFQYRFYKVDEKLTNEYERMKDLVLTETNGVADPHSLDLGILLENDSEVIAGAFLNTSVGPKVLLILNIYVDKKYRQQGIHTAMHTMIDKIAIELGKTSIFSNIHASNEIMVNYIMEKQNYKPFVYIVRRDVNK